MKSYQVETLCVLQPPSNIESCLSCWVHYRRWKKKNGLSICWLHRFKERRSKYRVMYLCVGLPLLLAVTWETQACDAGRCNVELCFLPPFSSPDSCCRATTCNFLSKSDKTDRELNPLDTWMILNYFSVSDLFWQRKSTSAKELLSSRRTARGRAVSLFPLNREETSTNWTIMLTLKRFSVCTEPTQNVCCHARGITNEFNVRGWLCNTTFVSVC